MKYINPHKQLSHQFPIDLNNEDFTHKAYRLFWEKAIERGFTPVSWLGDIKGIAPKNIVFRQYVQYSPEATKKLIDIQNEVSVAKGVAIPSLVVVRTDSESHNWTSDSSMAVLKNIFSASSPNPVGLGIQFDVGPADRFAIDARLKKTAQNIRDSLGVNPVAFSLARGADHYSGHASHFEGMYNLQDSSTVNQAFVYGSDSLGGARYGSFADALDRAEERNRPLMLTNAEGAWWSPESMTPWKRLNRIGTDLPGNFPQQYVQDVRRAGGFIPGEKGSMIVDPS